MSAVAARARGLTNQLLTPELLAEIDLARDAPGLAAALDRAGLPPEPAADAIDGVVERRIAHDLATLAHWSGALAPLELDEDRRSLRIVVRSLAAGLPASRRVAGAIATGTLPAPVLAALAAAPDLAGLVDVLARRGHPFASVLAGAPLDPLAIEIALARRFAELARSRDRAMRTYISQVIDAENASAALLLVLRGDGVPGAFVPGGRVLDRETFAAAIGKPVDGSALARSAAAGAPAIDAARGVLTAAFARTPLAAALFAPAPGALEDAALAWQLATQTRLRRTEPLGLAPAIQLVLRRRDEARRLRRAGWRLAMAGAP